MDRNCDCDHEVGCCLGKDCSYFGIDVDWVVLGKRYDVGWVDDSWVDSCNAGYCMMDCKVDCCNEGCCMVGCNGNCCNVCNCYWICMGWVLDCCMERS